MASTIRSRGLLGVRREAAAQSDAWVLTNAPRWHDPKARFVMTM
jgi:hypothetical protein